MMHIDFNSIVEAAWYDYDPSRAVRSISDISAMVSTNHVFRLRLEDETTVIAKFSYFGTYEDFVEDHSLINALANNLPEPYDNVLSRSLLRKNGLFTYRHRDGLLDSWVVFYNPIRVAHKLPRVLSEAQIATLGSELAHFHRACHRLRNILPDWSKTLKGDMLSLLWHLDTEEGQFRHRGTVDQIRRQVDLFDENMEKLGAYGWDSTPVFVDWNIGNFSVTDDAKLFSRWDYDWFRMSSRVLDFYFLSRVCSTVGDRTIFSYLIDPVMEPRFLIFLKAYHAIYPITRDEVLFMKEAYRFFILNYVVKYGHYFFHELYATKLQREAFDVYFPNLEKHFNPDPIFKALDL
jgi:Ser/Thr protein kinase RdoA (MazF antagonist)